MFNGEFRPKRQINLGGGNNRNRSRNNRSSNHRRLGDKTSVLEEARRQREERKIIQQRKDSCRSIQAIWRGYATRKRVVDQFYGFVLNYNDSLSKGNPTTKLSSANSISISSSSTAWKAIGFLLSPPLIVFLLRPTSSFEKISFLLETADKRFIETRTSADSIWKSDPKSIASIRIVYAALHLLSTSLSHKKKETSNVLVRIISILSQTNHNDENSNLNPNYLLLQSVFPALLFTLPHSINNDPFSNITQKLIQMACYTVTTNCTYSTFSTSAPPSSHNMYAKACLAAALFCNSKQVTPKLLHQTLHKALSQQPNTSFQYHSNDNQQSSFAQHYLLGPLAECIISSSFTFSHSSQNTKIFSQTHCISYQIKSSSQASIASSYVTLLKQIMESKELMLLSNVLPFLLINTQQTENQHSTSSLSPHYTSSPILIHLLHYALHKCRDLSIMMGIIAAETKTHDSYIQQWKSKHDNHSKNNNMNASDRFNYSIHQDDVSVDRSMDDDDFDIEEDDDENHNDTDQIMVDMTTTENHNNNNTHTNINITNSKRTIHQTNNRIGRNRKREEYLTIPKLSKVVSQYIAVQQKYVLSSSVSSTLSKNTIIPLATQLVDGHFLLTMGISILTLTPSTTISTTLRKGLKQTYCQVLSQILRGTLATYTVGFHHSPILSAMTLGGQASHDFINALWMFIQDPETTSSGATTTTITTTSIHDWKQTSRLLSDTGNHEQDNNIAASITFCDLFFYMLFTKDDEEFLALYTTNRTNQEHMTAESKSNQIVTARSVIIWLRNLMQKLYWTKPVSSYLLTSNLSTPIHTNSHQEQMQVQEDSIRLLLSGTKLYNALYERWCRLYKTHMFCEEKTWCFLHHTRIMGKVKDDDEVIVTEDNFDIMNDLDDESMELSDNNRNTTTILDDNNEASRKTEDESSALASSFRDTKIARLLTAIPQALPFGRRVALFNSLLTASKRKSQSELATIQDVLNPDQSTRNFYTIRRDNLYQDSMEQLNKPGQNLKGKLQIKFVNEHGFEEAGVDGGGLFKEFLDDLVREAFQPNVNVPLFSVSSLETLYVSPGTENLQSHYTFLGRVLGKAVYESILVEPQFCTPFLNQLLGKQNSLDDLKYLDPEFYRHLKELRSMTDEDIAGLGLSFELTTTTATGGTTTIELIPNGSNIPLKRENLLQYVYLVSNYKLNVEGAHQTRAFLRGFRDLVPSPWLRLFSSYELQKLVSGDDTIQGIDVKALKETVVYAGGYHPSQPIIQWFWEILDHEFTVHQQRMFLKFMTSCSRQPLLGFGALSPIPCIRQVRLSDNIDTNAHHGDGETSGGKEKDMKLPTSSTCMNLLKLPAYSSKVILKEKLIYAIESGAGFELS